MKNNNNSALLKSYGIVVHLGVKLSKLPTTTTNKMSEKIETQLLKPSYKSKSRASQVVDTDTNKLADDGPKEIGSKSKRDNELLLLHGITSQIQIHIVKKDVPQLMNKLDSKTVNKPWNKTKQIMHSVRRLYKCPTCPSHVQLSPGLLIKHIATHHKSKNVLKCSFPNCKFFTRVLYFLNTHLARVHHQLPFHCSVCPKKCKTQSNLRVHMLKHSAPESKKYICPRTNCEYANHYLSGLKTHLKSHLEINYKCPNPNCSWRTKHEKSLAAHVQNIHGNRNNTKPLKCPQCNYTAENLSEVKLHSKVHSDQKPFKCHLCKFSTKYLNSFKDHLVVHSGLKRFECHLCGKKIRTSQNLQDHVKRHLGEKPFKCPESACDYVAATRSEIKLHGNIYHLNDGETRIKRFKCPLCTKAFYERRSLTAHAHIHTLEKPFSCLFCSREFKANNSKKNHENCCRNRPGGKLKPHKCEYCEMQFGRTDHKSLHEMTCKFRLDRKIIQPFKCSVDGCSFAATQKANLKLHCNKFHQ